MGDWKSDEVMGSVDAYTEGTFGVATVEAVSDLPSVMDVGNGIPEHLVQMFVDTPVSETTERMALVDIICKYSDFFATPEMGVSSKLGFTTDMVHYIDTGDASPFKLPYRRASLSHKDSLE